MKRYPAIVAIALCGCSQPVEHAKEKLEKVQVQRPTPVQIFDLRTKCQALVDKAVEQYAIGVVGKALTADVKSHYNPQTNRCYAEVIVTKNFGFDYPKTPDNYRSDALYDAQTRDQLMIASQAGERRSGTDFTPGALANPTYESITSKIETLMTQE
jgi:hypothetical protein